LAETHTILLVDDEPLILMDLEMAAEDRSLGYLSAPSVERALALIETGDPAIDLAVLDFTLLHGTDCLPIARRLQQLGIPFIVHSGDLDRSEKGLGDLDAVLVQKPAHSDKVIAAALVEMKASGDRPRPLAAS
tara:strand:- start:2770 stop:3168 length:399 start_codon:yes stop_codon:yes gene_type:complete